MRFVSFLQTPTLLPLQRLRSLCGGQCIGRFKNDGGNLNGAGDKEIEGMDGEMRNEKRVIGERGIVCGKESKRDFCFE